MLIDDEHSVKLYLKAELQHLISRVTVFARPQEVLDSFSGAASFDLLISYISMPEMDGRQLLEQIPAGQPVFPVLFISGMVKLWAFMR